MSLRDERTLSAFSGRLFRPSDALLAQLRDLDALVCFEVALAPKPIFHRGSQPIEGHAMSRFEEPIGARQRVIEYGVVGEVPHGKVVDPVERARVAKAFRVDSLNR